MKLLELEIANTRGIKELVLTPAGENLVVYGPNGSGKSAVVDAIDFLLTGKISRLLGRGSKKLSLKAHGPHVDHKPADAFVRGVFQLRGYPKPVTLCRRFSTPASVELSPDDAKDAVAPVIDVAAKGQHVLSRRQILQYVAAEPNERAAEVQVLLDLEEVEDVRKALTTAANSARRDQQKAAGDRALAEGTVARTLQLGAYSDSAVVGAVNAQRAVLQGDALEKPGAADLKRGLPPPSTSSSGMPSVADVERACSEMDAALPDATKKASEDAVHLRELAGALVRDQGALSALKKLRLFELGVSLLAPDGACPLCGTAWAPGELRTHLEQHIENAKELAERQKKAKLVAQALVGISVGVRVSIRSVSVQALALGFADGVTRLEAWERDLVAWESALAKDQIEEVKDAIRDDATVAALFAPSRWTETRAALAKLAQEKGVVKTPQQAAWDVLTRLEENQKQLEAAVSTAKRAKAVATAGQISLDAFEAARNSVLESLYKAIEGRFSALYRAIHQEDEAGFAASLRPEGAALNFEVEFYGRGKFPPLAVHSEGHQDTMGIALYLALAERLTSGFIDLTILDDVVMSVDAGHRRQICEVLKDEFPGRQFIITTHDRMWARQLRSVGIVKRSNSIEFSRWTLTAGPLIGTEKDMWARIDEFLKGGDVIRAAHTLRRGAEECLEEVCARLRAEVVYKTDEAWELGDWSPAAYRRYKTLLAKARAAAQSWKKDEDAARIEELETVAAQSYEQAQIERWPINPNVHYSRWADFSPADFKPVVDAWRGFLELFSCVKCEMALFIGLDADRKETTLRCGCESVSWNLLRKASGKPA